MSGEDHERFEAYLELERYIAELQAGRVAHPPDELTPSQLRMYQMAALLRSASSEEATPRPEFVAALQILLEQELRQPAPTKRTFPFLPQKRPRISRRALLTGGAAVAASLVIGAGIERVVEESRTGSPDSAYPPLVPSGIPTTWYFVTTLANLGASAVRFATDTIVGHVIRDVDDGGDPNEGRVIALSAACTHMGCIVDWYQRRPGTLSQAVATVRDEGGGRRDICQGASEPDKDSSQALMLFARCPSKFQAAAPTP